MQSEAEHSKENVPASSINRPPSRREQLKQWREQKPTVGKGKGGPATTSATLAPATTTSVRPSTSRSAASSAQRSGITSSSKLPTAEASKSLKMGPRSTSVRTTKSAIGSAATTKSKREEELMKYKAQKQRIQEMKAPHKTVNERVIHPQDKKAGKAEVRQRQPAAPPTKSRPHGLSESDKSNRTTTQPEARTNRGKGKLANSTETQKALKKLFDAKIEKAMFHCTAGELKKASVVLQSLMAERFNPFRTCSSFWIVRARFAEARGDYAEAIRLLDQGSIACHQKVNDAIRLGNAVACFLMRTQEKSNSLDDDPAVPMSHISSDSSPSTFYFNELAPECEEFLRECQQKVKNLKQEDTDQIRLPPGISSPYVDKLRQVVEAIKNSPLSLVNKSREVSLSSSQQASAPPQSPYIGHSLATVPSTYLDTIKVECPKDDGLSNDSHLPQPCIEVTKDSALQPQTPYSIALPPSPTPPELSESTLQLVTPPNRKVVYPRSPCAPTLTPTTRQALGEKVDESEVSARVSLRTPVIPFVLPARPNLPAASPHAREDGASPMLPTPKRIVVAPSPQVASVNAHHDRRGSLPARRKSYASPTVSSMQRGSATVQRPSKTALARGTEKELMIRALHNRSAQLFPAQDTAAQSEFPSSEQSTPRNQELHDRSEEPTGGSNSSELMQQEELSSSFCLLNLSSAEDISLQEQLPEHKSTTFTKQTEVDESKNPAPVTPSPYDRRKLRNLSCAPVASVTPGFGRFETLAAVRYDNVNQNGKPILISSIPRLTSSMRKADLTTASPVVPMETMENQENNPETEEILLTPVRRCYRLRNKSTSARRTPHPPSGQTVSSAHDEEEAEQDPEIKEQTTELAAIENAELKRINYKTTTAAAKLHTPHPFGRRRAADEKAQKVMLLTNPYFAPSTDV